MDGWHTAFLLGSLSFDLSGVKCWLRRPSLLSGKLLPLLILRLKSRLQGIGHPFVLQITSNPSCFHPTGIYNVLTVCARLSPPCATTQITESTQGDFEECPGSRGAASQHRFSSPVSSQFPAVTERLWRKQKNRPPQEGVWDSWPVAAPFGKPLALYKCLKSSAAEVGREPTQFSHKPKRQPAVQSLLPPLPALLLVLQRCCRFAGPVSTGTRAREGASVRFAATCLAHSRPPRMFLRSISE